jgi:hypothetical protein
MSDRDHQFLDYYEGQRVEDQLAYYRSAERRYGRRADLLVALTSLLMFVAAACSAVVGFGSDTMPGRAIWVIAAALVPALSAAVAATRNLFEDERNRQRYDATRIDLQLLSASGAPTVSLPPDEFRARLVEYVQQVEELLSREHRQWVETMAAVPDAQPPQPEAAGPVAG